MCSLSFFLPTPAVTQQLLTHINYTHLGAFLQLRQEQSGNTDGGENARKRESVEYVSHATQRPVQAVIAVECC